MIEETIQWTLLKDKWPEVGDDTLSLVVSTDGEDGPEFSVIDACTCYEECYDFDAVYQHDGNSLSYIWFEDANGNDVEGTVHAWTYGPTGKGVIDMLSAPYRPQDKPRNSLIPFESELS